jgi:hypothetical protein
MQSESGNQFKRDNQQELQLLTPSQDTAKGLSGSLSGRRNIFTLLVVQPLTIHLSIIVVSLTASVKVM